MSSSRKKVDPPVGEVVENTVVDNENQVNTVDEVESIPGQDIVSNVDEEVSIGKSLEEAFTYKSETPERIPGKEDIVSDKEEFEYNICCEREMIADHLETLARFFRDGQIKLSTTEDSIILNPTSKVKLEITAKNKTQKNKGELKIEISWKEKAPAEAIEIKPVG